VNGDNSPVPEPRLRAAWRRDTVLVLVDLPRPPDPAQIDGTVVRPPRPLAEPQPQGAGGHRVTSGLYRGAAMVLYPPPARGGYQGRRRARLMWWRRSPRPGEGGPR
jgi:hypothetical protein